MWKAVAIVSRLRSDPFPRRSAPSRSADAAWPLSHRLKHCHVQRLGDEQRVMDRIEALIGRLAPMAICDACVVERLDLATPELASQNIRALAGMHGYVRETCDCALCGEAKPAIRQASH